MSFSSCFSIAIPQSPASWSARFGDAPFLVASRKIFLASVFGIPQVSVGEMIPSSSSSRSSEEYLVAKCANFTLLVGVRNATEYAATIGGKNNFILRRIKDDYRSIGAHLSGCVQPDQQNSENNKPFHMVTLSSDISTGGMVSDHAMVASGDRLFLSRDGFTWYELLRE
jgi:hypothetical protein